MKSAFSLLLPILILAIGLPLLLGTSSLVPSPKVACIVILIVFVTYNIVGGYFLSLTGRLKVVWSWEKIWHFPTGFLIGSVPIGTAYFWYFLQGDLPGYQGMAILTAFLTLATVSWEELWFRGIALELGASKYSKLGVAVLFGVIFSLLHTMNPKISLLEDGPQLVLAGYTLSVCYFAFDSIWAPIGMHFANNSIQAAFGKSTEPRTLTFTGPLLVIALIFTLVVWRRVAATRSEQQL